MQQVLLCPLSSISSSLVLFLQCRLCRWARVWSRYSRRYLVPHLCWWWWLRQRQQLLFIRTVYLGTSWGIWCSTLCLTYNVEDDDLAAGGVVATWDLTLVFSSIIRSHVSDHQHELRPLLPHHGLHPGVQRVAQVVESHQLWYWSGVLHPGNLSKWRIWI